MNDTILGFVGYITWTLILLIWIATYRTLLVTSKQRAPNSFKADGSNSPAFGERLTRAQSNCVESFAFIGGLMPKPGAKEQMFPLNQPILCGGVTIYAGDYIVADEDGIAVIPQDKLTEVYHLAKARTDKDNSMNLTEWEVQHSKKIESKLQELGYSD